MPGSTNYISAYDKRGNLLRDKGKGEKKQADSASENATEDGETADEAALKAAATDDYQLPPETLEDLRPFPLNRDFTSESILSEDMRLEIWNRVQRQAKSVRQVSTEMGVDMRRVAAVVRLVELENRMRAEVITPSISPSAIPTLFFMMNYQNRLVFQTSKHGDFQNKLQLSEISHHATAS